MPIKALKKKNRVDLEPNGYGCGVHVCVCQCLVSPVCCLLSNVCCLLSVVCCLLSVVCFALLALFCFALLCFALLCLSMSLYVLYVCKHISWCFMCYLLFLFCIYVFVCIVCHIAPFQLYSRSYYYCYCYY